MSSVMHGFKTKHDFIVTNLAEAMTKQLFDGLCARGRHIEHAAHQ